MIEATVMDRRWQLVLDCMDQATAPFSKTTLVAFRFELVAAGVSGDLAYTVGYEHAAASMDGAPTQYTLQATHLYRREHGEWTIVPRHGDFPGR